MKTVADIAAAYWHWVLITSFLIAISLESIWPDNRIRARVLPRWLTHAASYVACVLLSSSVLPAFLVAVFTERVGTGPERAFAWVDGWGGPIAVLAIGLLGIDLIEYVAHWCEHRFRLLWRFHAVHHADPDVDASTTLLHHPIAYLITAGMIGVVMTALGLPATVYPIYGLCAVIAGTFQHTGTPTSDRLERLASIVLVTPGMHLTHHSDAPAHYGTNFGTLLSVWDRMFGTLLLLDAHGRAAIRFGIGAVPGTTLTEPGTREHGLWGVLTLPFRMRFPPEHDAPARQALDLAEPGPVQTVRQT